MTGSPDDALRRRLRDDPAAAAHLEDLRRAAYGRDGSTAPLVEVPAALREEGGVDARELPGPLVALLTEEARLAAEGRALRDADGAAPVPAPAAPTETDPGSDSGDASGSRLDHADADAAADGPAPAAAAPPTRLARARLLLRPAPLAAAVAGVLLLAGLGTASSAGILTDDDSWRRQTPTSSPRPPSTPDPRIGSPVPEFTAEPPVETPLTEAETLEALQAEADLRWEDILTAQPDAVRPDVGLERIVSSSEYMPQQAECLRAGGVDATVEGPGAMTYSSADPVLLYSCAVRFPQQPTGPPSDALLAYIHDYYVSYLMPCYASEGKAYDGEVPDVDAFIAGIRAGDYWTPFPSTMDTMLQAVCSEVPPGLP